jgi:hypothetical protein
MTPRKINPPILVRKKINKGKVNPQFKSFPKIKLF